MPSRILHPSALTAAVVTGVLALAACSSGTPEPEETRSDEELIAAYEEQSRLDALVTPDVPVPADLAVAAPGTTVPVGTWAAAPMTADDGTGWIAAIRVVELRAGSVDPDFGAFDQEAIANLGDGTPSYLTVEFSRLDGDTMTDDPDAQMTVVLSDGTTASRPTIIGGLGRDSSTPFCVPSKPTENIPEQVGDVFSGCEIYMVPPGTTATAVEWTLGEGYAEAPLRWTL